MNVEDLIDRLERQAASADARSERASAGRHYRQWQQNMDIAGTYRVAIEIVKEWAANPQNIPPSNLCRTIEAKED